MDEPLDLSVKVKEPFQNPASNKTVKNEVLRIEHVKGECEISDDMRNKVLTVSSNEEAGNYKALHDMIDNSEHRSSFNCKVQSDTSIIHSEQMNSDRRQIINDVNVELTHKRQTLSSPSSEENEIVNDGILRLPGYGDHVEDDDTGPIRMTTDGVTLTVVDSWLWKSFKKIQNEMIINRGGRRMFPYIAVTFDGLSSDMIYDVILEIVPADNIRYKYVNETWMPVGRADIVFTNAPYIHHESPFLGDDLMKKSISFARVKLTNNKDLVEGQVLLQSMCKYIMKISVVEREEQRRVFSFLLKETTFIAVTAYQNSKITNLKIQNNPFAKAFRKSRSKKTSRNAKYPEVHEMSMDSSCVSLDVSKEEIPAKQQRVKSVTMSPSCSSQNSTPIATQPFPTMKSMSLYGPWIPRDYNTFTAAILSYHKKLSALKRPSQES